MEKPPSRLTKRSIRATDDTAVCNAGVALARRREPIEERGILWSWRRQGKGKQNGCWTTA